MFTLTDAAREKVAALLAARDEPGLALRIAVTGRRFGRFVYDLAFVGPSGRQESDLLVQEEPFAVYVDQASAAKLEGARLDYVSNELASGFAVENPNSVWDDPTAAAVQRLIDEEINPMLWQHGGMLSLVDVRDGIAYVEFGGGCLGCSMVDSTLRDGVEAQIKEAFPEILAVVDTSDHGRFAGGGISPFAEE